MELISNGDERYSIGNIVTGIIIALHDEQMIATLVVTWNKVHSCQIIMLHPWNWCNIVCQPYFAKKIFWIAGESQSKQTILKYFDKNRMLQITHANSKLKTKIKQYNRIQFN